MRSRDLLVKVGNHFKEANIFTFGNIDDQAFIDKFPSGKTGLKVLLTETTKTRQNIKFDNKAESYEQRTVSIYVFGNLIEAKDLADDIYESLRLDTRIGQAIFSIVAESPVYVDDLVNTDHVYIVEFECKVR